MNTLAAKESEDTQSVLCDYDDSFTAHLKHQIIPSVHTSASGKVTSAKKLPVLSLGGKSRGSRTHETKQQQADLSCYKGVQWYQNLMNK